MRNTKVNKQQDISSLVDLFGAMTVTVSPQAIAQDAYSRHCISQYAYTARRRSTEASQCDGQPTIHLCIAQDQIYGKLTVTALDHSSRIWHAYH